ncbi:hypothetical protein [Methyloceanibacter sp.]|uniref:hypothetical protein n=1 Tax=Methyloceanibacter sp. TaxID=1965321 RepID=UPI003D6D5E66
MSANDCENIGQVRARSKRALDRQNKEAIALFSTVDDFTVFDAACLLTGRDPIFWGAPSADVLLNRKSQHKHLGKSVALFKELLKQLEGNQLRATSLAFNGDGTCDPEKTRVSRAELNAFRKTCRIATVPLPGTPVLLRRADVAAPAVVEALGREKGAIPEVKTEPSEEAHTGETIVKRNVLFDRLGVKYARFEKAMRTSGSVFATCRVPKNKSPGGAGGFYYLESVEKICASKWRDNASTRTLYSSKTHRTLQQRSRMIDDKKWVARKDQE